MEITAENCSEKALVNLFLEWKFIVFEIHHMNFAMNSVSESSQALVENIHRSILKLRNHVIPAQLCVHTLIHAKIPCPTSWIFVHNCITSYVELIEKVTELLDPETGELMISRREQDEVQIICRRSGEFNSFTTSLEADDTAIADFRALLDAVIEEFKDY